MFILIRGAFCDNAALFQPRVKVTKLFARGSCDVVVRRSAGGKCAFSDGGRNTCCRGCFVRETVIVIIITTAAI